MPSLNTHLGPDDALDGRRSRPVDEAVACQRVCHLALLGQPEVALGGGAVEAAGEAVVPRDMQVDRHRRSRGGLPHSGFLRALGYYSLALVPSAFLHHVLWMQGTQRQSSLMKAHVQAASPLLRACLPQAASPLLRARLPPIMQRGLKDKASGLPFTPRDPRTCILCRPVRKDIIYLQRGAKTVTAERQTQSTKSAVIYLWIAFTSFSPHLPLLASPNAMPPSIVH